MDTKEIIFMKKGDGENSYAQRSEYTQKLAEKIKPVLERTIQTLFTRDFFLESNNKLQINVADLGCSSNPTSYRVMSTVIETVKMKCQDLNYNYNNDLEFQFYLNDLPGNDFNTLFKGLSSFYERNNKEGISCFVMAAPGSFYGRLFPHNNIHLLHSSYSVHWLSQVPRLTSEEGVALNKGKMYVSKTSPPAVSKGYLTQFHKDFTLFLKCRSQEMVSDGRMVLTVHGRQSPDPASKQSCFLWDLLALAISDIVAQGLVEESKLDTFNIPYYIPSKEEIQDIVEKEGSFSIEYLDAFTIEPGGTNTWPDLEMIVNGVRAFTEPMISSHFGPNVMDELYQRFAHRFKDVAEERPGGGNIAVVLRRNVK